MPEISQTIPTKETSPDTLPVSGHLEELRRRIFYILGYLAAGTLAGLFFAQEFILLLKMPASAISSNFILVKPTDIVSIYFKIALYTGVVFTAPAIFYNFWCYVKPAIPKDADISPVPWALSAGALFCLGTVFSYTFLLPSAYKFLMRLSQEAATPMITLSSYISFALSIIVVGGGVFEMPLVSALLTRLRIITPALLKARRKEAVFSLCVIAALVTPTTDIFNMALFLLPMIALFEISVVTASLVNKLYLKDPSGEVYAN